MKILDNSHDYFHLIDDPGGYEWTYYDGFSEDRSIGFTAIWFRGVPMSPNYSAAIDRGRGIPSNFAACAFHLYADGKNVASWLVEGEGGDRFSLRPDEPIQLGGARLYLNREIGGATSARIAIEGITPLMRRSVVGEINLRFPHGDPGIAPDGSDVDRSLAEHYWVPAAPHGTFDAAFDVKSLLGSKSSYRFSGDCYHDRNFGFAPIQTEDVDWIWGRVHDRDQTLIFYYVARRGEPSLEERDTPLRLTFATLVKEGRVVAQTEGLQLRAIYAPHWTSLPFPRSLICRSDGDLSLKFDVTTSDLLESGPFYHRSSARIFYEWGEQTGSGVGTLEYLRPSRLGVSIFRPFVRFRVRKTPGGIFS